MDIASSSPFPLYHNPKICKFNFEAYTQSGAIRGHQLTSYKLDLLELFKKWPPTTSDSLKNELQILVLWYKGKWEDVVLCLSYEIFALAI